MAALTVQPWSLLSLAYEVRAEEESHVHMRRKHIHIAQRDVLHAGHRATVMQQFPNVRAALAHAIEPMTGEGGEGRVARGEPGIDGRVPLSG